ncbi:ABC transporter permease [Prosthecomicrobium sp. N25]|uniref:ABC transporter permease n=1 Tax=Prosthecomicrobium sp. N25 TaxID=3129254 RepID=UPI003078A29C
MAVFLVRRLMQSAFVLFAMSVLVFVGVFAIGNPVDILIAPEASHADRERIITQMGLDRPLIEQYFSFVGGVLGGDFGKSFVFKISAIDLILDRLPATLELAVSAMVLSLLVGLPLGMVAGMKPDGLLGRSIMAGSILGFSLPTFWVGLILIMVFAVHLGWLPSTGRGQTVEVLGVRWSFLTLDGLSHLVLPALNLALFKISLVIRLTRAGMRDVLASDYVRYAHAKGLTARRVLMVHALKNILIPLVTVLGLEFGSVIAFAIVTETIFAWPGTGKLIIESINTLDRPVMVAYLMIIVAIFVAINLIVDLTYSLLDPRIRLDGSAS